MHSWPFHRTNRTLFDFACSPFWKSLAKCTTRGGSCQSVSMDWKSIWNKNTLQFFLSSFFIGPLFLFLFLFVFMHDIGWDSKTRKTWRIYAKVGQSKGISSPHWGPSQAEVALIKGNFVPIGGALFFQFLFLPNLNCLDWILLEYRKNSVSSFWSMWKTETERFSPGFMKMIAYTFSVWMIDTRKNSITNLKLKMRVAYLMMCVYIYTIHQWRI